MTFLLYLISISPVVQKSRLILVPSKLPRPEGDVALPAASSLKESTLSDGTSELIVPWPLHVEELKDLLGDKLEKYRIIHLTNATKVGESSPDGNVWLSIHQTINSLPDLSVYHLTLR